MLMRGRAQEEPPSAPVRLLACDTLGLLKGIAGPNFANIGEAQVVSTWGKPNRERKAAGCVAISSRSLQAQGQTYAALGHCDGSIRILDAINGEFAAEIQCGTNLDRSSAPDDRAVVGLCFLAEHPGRSPPPLMACTRGGSVSLHQPDKSEEDAIRWNSSANWSVPKPLHCMDISTASLKAAFGNEGSELSIWDIATQQRDYIAKGSKPNRIGLVDHSNNTAVAFIPGTEATQVLTGTAKHKLLLYDVKHGRRPVLDISFGEARISALAAEACGERVWVATAAGQIEVLDIRAGRMSGALKGSTGSVRALDLHPTEPLIASVGLDRHLRLHNTATRKQVASVYMKQHLMDVTFCPSPAPQKEAKEGAAAEVPAEGQRAKAIKRHHKGVNCGAAL